MKTRINNEEFGRPVAYYKNFADITGCVKAAILLSQALYWSTRSSLSDGWFWKSMPEWESETGLTPYEQKSARKKLVNLNFIVETRKGKRAGSDMHYRLNLKIIHRAIVNLELSHD